MASNSFMYSCPPYLLQSMASFLLSSSTVVCSKSLLRRGFISTALMSRCCFNNISRVEMVGSQTDSLDLAFCVVEEMARLHSLSQSLTSTRQPGAELLHFLLRDDADKGNRVPPLVVLEGRPLITALISCFCNIITKIIDLFTYHVHARGSIIYV
jgi:hypothetical protein